MQTILLIVFYLIKLYASVVLLRFFMQYFRVDFYNPFAQTIVQLTNPTLKPLRRVIPGYKGLDIASLVLAFLLTTVMLSLAFNLWGLFTLTNLPKLAIIFVLQFFYTLLNLFFYLLIGRIIVSFIMMAAGSYQANPFASMLVQLTQPFMTPFQRIIPPIGMLDLSPILVFLLIRLTQEGLQYVASYIFPGLGLL